MFNLVETAKQGNIINAIGLGALITASAYTPKSTVVYVIAALGLVITIWGIARTRSALTDLSDMEKLATPIIEHLQPHRIVTARVQATEQGHVKLEVRVRDTSPEQGGEDAQEL